MQYVGETTRFCIVNTERDALRVIGRAPLRTIRAVDLAEVYAHPGAELASMQRRGVVHRLDAACWRAPRLDGRTPRQGQLLGWSAAERVRSHEGHRVRCSLCRI